MAKNRGGEGGKSSLLYKLPKYMKTGFTPHGVSFEEFEAASQGEQSPQFISKGTIAFMFESSRMFTLTNYAMTSPNKHEHEPKMWDPLRAQFADNLEEVNEALRADGQTPIQLEEVQS